MLAYRFGPTIELESLQQHKGPRLGNALQYSEDAADMHQRRVDDRNTATQLPSGPVTGRASGPITLCASMS